MAQPTIVNYFTINTGPDNTGNNNSNNNTSNNAGNSASQVVQVTSQLSKTTIHQVPMIRIQNIDNFGPFHNTRMESYNFTSNGNRRTFNVESISVNGSPIINTTNRNSELYLNFGQRLASLSRVGVVSFLQNSSTPFRNLWTRSGNGIVSEHLSSNMFIYLNDVIKEIFTVCNILQLPLKIVIIEKDQSKLVVNKFEISTPY